MSCFYNVLWWQMSTQSEGKCIQIQTGDKIARLAGMTVSRMKRQWQRLVILPLLFVCILSKAVGKWVFGGANIKLTHTSSQRVIGSPFIDTQHSSADYQQSSQLALLPSQIFEGVVSTFMIRTGSLEYHWTTVSSECPTAKTQMGEFIKLFDDYLPRLSLRSL